MVGRTVSVQFLTTSGLKSPPSLPVRRQIKAENREREREREREIERERERDKQRQTDK